MPDTTSASFNPRSFALAPRPALFGKTPIEGRGVSLEPIFGGHVIHALGQTGDRYAAVAIEDAVAGIPSAARNLSPGQWFIVGDSNLTTDALDSLTARLAPVLELFDQTHGRVRIRLRGPNAARVLAKGTAVDLAPSSFPVGRSAITLIGHIGAHITRTDADSFEILVLRGFAESLWDDLEHMSREFL